MSTTVSSIPSATKASKAKKAFTTSKDTLEQFKLFIDAALRGEGKNDELLELTKNDTHTLEADIHTVTSTFDKVKAPLKAIVVSVLAKLVYPSWDTRKHQPQIGGEHSLRSIDSTYVCPYLYSISLYPEATAFALTRSFEKSEPFTKNYNGKAKYPEQMSAFLNIVHSINEQYSPELCKAILAKCMFFLQQRKLAGDVLKSTTLSVSQSVSLKTVQTLLAKVFTSTSSGIAVVPAIVIHTALSIVQPHLWPGCTIKPLKEHTAADGNSKAIGDVEGYRADNTPFLSVEVKYNIQLDSTLISTFEAKTTDVPLRYMVTTKERVCEATDSNIILSTVNDAVLHILQPALVHKKTIPLEFVQSLRSTILYYRNLGLPARTAINKVFTEILA